VNPDQPPYAATPTPAAAPTPVPPARRPRLPWILGAVVAVILLAAGIGIGTAFFLAADEPAPAPPATLQGDGNALPSVEDEVLPDPAPTTAGPLLTMADLKLSLKVTDKQCFGSAGCSITAKVEAAMATGFKSAETWEITYEITGVEDGPIIGSFELTDGQYDVNEEFFETKNKKSKPAIKVTEVEKLGV
jgi:hypothetical protein